MFQVPEYTDDELIEFGVPLRPDGRTRREEYAVAATKHAIMKAPAALRVGLLQALLGGQLSVLLANAVQAEVRPEDLVLRQLRGRFGPDLVLGYQRTDPSGTLVFVVLIVFEFKRDAADNYPLTDDPRLPSHQVAWTTDGGRARTGAIVNQCVSYRGEPRRWLDSQPGRWQLNAEQAGGVLWLMICEYERDVPDGWTLLAWAPLISHALWLVRQRVPGALSAGLLLQEWIAPPAERPYYPFPFGSRAACYGSLRRAAREAWNTDRMMIKHRHRDSVLQVAPTGGWLILDSSGIELPTGHPEIRPWRDDLSAAGELHADDTCPDASCWPTGARAWQCGHLDIHGNSWWGLI